MSNGSTPNPSRISWAIAAIAEAYPNRPSGLISLSRSTISDINERTGIWFSTIGFARNCPSRRDIDVSDVEPSVTWTKCSGGCAPLSGALLDGRQLQAARGRPPVLTGPLYRPRVALLRNALALGLVPEHHDLLYGLAADPAVLLDRKAGRRPSAR